MCQGARDAAPLLTKTPLAMRILTLAALFTIANLAVGTAQQFEWARMYEFTGGHVIRDVSCATADSCLAIFGERGGLEQSIVRSTDGGRTWHTSYRFDSARANWTRIRAVAFVNSRFAIASTDSGDVIRSTDGGESWSRSVVFEETRLPQISMLNDSVGAIAAGLAPEPTILVTTDGGASWMKRLVPMPAASQWVYLTDVNVISPTTIVVPINGDTSDSAIAISHDLGVTWQHHFGLPSLTQRTSFVDSLTGLAISWRGKDGSYSTISKTTDGGLTWRAVYDTLTQPIGRLIELEWGDARRVLVSGARGAIHRSTDGGESWTLERIEGRPIDINYLYLTFPSGSDGLLADGINARIYRASARSFVAAGSWEDEAQANVAIRAGMDLELASSSGEPFSRVVVCDAAGRCIYDEIQIGVTGRTLLRTKEWQPGVYLIQASAGSKAIMKRLVILP
jgi:photosystem II stability/assembly factor-like uncharacterized protein